MLFNSIEYDCINDQLATFISPFTINVFPNLSSYQRDADESIGFATRFIAENVNKNPFREGLNMGHDEQERNQYLCPSEFVYNLCALDSITNMIKVWNIGTGHLVSEQYEEKYNFAGFKKHNEWNGSTLVILEKDT